MVWVTVLWHTHRHCDALHKCEGASNSLPTPFRCFFFNVFCISVLQQNDRMGTDYSAICLGLWAAREIKSYSLHTYSICLWGSEWIPRSMIINDFRFSIETRLHHQLGTEQWLWGTVDEDLAFASLLCFVDALESTCQGHWWAHGNGKEGWRKGHISANWAKISLPSLTLFLSDTWAQWHKSK